MDNHEKIKAIEKIQKGEFTIVKNKCEKCKCPYNTSYGYYCVCEKLSTELTCGID